MPDPVAHGRLVLVGGGRMGEALAVGLLAAGLVGEDDLVVVERLDARRAALIDRLAERASGPTVVASMPDEVSDAVVAVKPGDVPEACRALAHAGAGRVLSIAAGVGLADLQRWLADAPRPVAVLRAMPNTPALVGAAASALAAGEHAGAADLAWGAELLGAVGTVEVVPEALLDAVTGLSGSGPAYLYLLAEALIDAGVQEGLARDQAARLTVQTLLGASRMLAEAPSDQGPVTLRAAVTSPGGTTAAGLRALERAGFRSAVADAVAAATERSRQLGRS